MKKYLLLVICSVLLTGFLFAQGTESFTNIPAAASSYAAQTWTGDNGLSWTATDSRTDQVVTAGNKAICVRVGSVTCNSITGGVGSLTFKYLQAFGTVGSLEVRINTVLIGTLTPSTTVQTATFNNINVSGNFDLEIRQTVANGRTSIDDIAWTSGNVTACTTPAAQPTNLVFGTITTSSIAGSFTLASPTADAYLVVRSNSSSLSSLPADGTIYEEDDVIGNGVVVSNGNTTNFTATTLTPNTAYYFYVFSINSNCSGGPLYLTTSPLTNNTSTPAPPVCVAPSTAPGVLSLTPTPTSITGNFGAATGADGYLVIKSNSSSLSASPVNGITYAEGTSFGGGTVIQYNSSTAFSAAGLTPLTTYYFYVFAVSGFNCTGGPLYKATSTNANVATTNSGNTGEPAGYYSTTTGLTCSGLKTALKTIVTSGHSAQSYSGLWSQYPLTDIRPRPSGGGSSNVIWDIYSFSGSTANYYFTPSTNQCGTYSGEGSCYNREHSFPASWFKDEAPSYTDYNHIFPTDGYVNNRRSNYRYGEVASATYTSTNGSKLGSSATAGISGTVFEPINEFKGDVARAYLYMVTRYQDRIATWSGYSTDGALTLSGNTFPSVNVTYLKLMLKWHNQDPVNQKEIDRNNGTYSFQGNRNPYIDHPEFVNLVWNSTCPGLAALPVNILYFSGKLQNNKVLLNWESENEINFNRYEVERSFNGTDYAFIGSVKSTGVKSYNYTDVADNIKGRRVYYRLKKVDNDGAYTYSEIFTLHIPLNIKFTIYPNPATDFITVQLNNNTTEKVTIVLTDITGKIVLNKSYESNNGLISIATQTLTTGTYIVKLFAGNESYMQKVVVVK